MESDQYLGWLALALTPGLGARTAGKLLREFGSPEAVFNASLTSLEAQRLPAAVAQAIHSRRAMSDAAKELAQAQAYGCRLLTWDEPEYPARLREIYDPPPLLYVVGNVDLLSRHLISIVGSRRPTPYGNQMAERLARDLAERGIVITKRPLRAGSMPVRTEERLLSSCNRCTIGVSRLRWHRRDLPGRWSKQEDLSPKSSNEGQSSANFRWGLSPRPKISLSATVESSREWGWGLWLWRERSILDP